MSQNIQPMSDFSSSANKAGHNFADVENPPEGQTPEQLFAQAAKIGIDRNALNDRLRAQDPTHWGYEAEKIAARIKDQKAGVDPNSQESAYRRISQDYEQWNQARKKDTNIYDEQYSFRNNEKVTAIVSALQQIVDRNNVSVANGNILANMLGSNTFGMNMLATNSINSMYSTSNIINTDSLNSGLNYGGNFGYNPLSMMAPLMLPMPVMTSPMMGIWGGSAPQNNSKDYTPQSFARPNATTEEKNQAYNAFQHISPFQNNFSLKQFGSNMGLGGLIGAGLPWLAMLAIL